MAFTKYQKVEKVEPLKKEAVTIKDGEKPKLDQLKQS